jgi:hypothetical protein
MIAAVKKPNRAGRTRIDDLAGFYYPEAEDTAKEVLWPAANLVVGMTPVRSAGLATPGARIALMRVQNRIRTSSDSEEDDVRPPPHHSPSPPLKR